MADVHTDFHSSENIPKLDTKLVNIEIVEDQKLLLAKPAEYVSEAGLVLDTANSECNPECDTEIVKEQEITMENVNDRKAMLILVSNRSADLALRPVPFRYYRFWRLAHE
ncbi:hypothetical protein FQA39_LY08696 [Lamprigera yunnana]|nr:hypothetical protein FQA39_LY08696 [Lamprigera yunnana]